MGRGEWVMGQLLVVLFFLAMLVVAPIKASLTFMGALLLATLVVQSVTSSISHVQVTLGASFKAIVLSLFFAAVAVFTIISFTVGAPRFMFNELSGLLLTGLQYGAYILGFRIALGLTFSHAAMVAIASTLITSMSIWFIVKMSHLG